MHKAKWLISLYDENCEKIANIARLMGYEVKCVGRNDNLDGKSWKYAYPAGDCVIFMGSLPFAREVSNLYWIPGSVCDLDFFKYKNYSKYIGSDLLNWPYSITTHGCYKQTREHWFDLYGNSDCIFVRPDSGFKTFTGHVVEKDKPCNIDKYDIVDDDELIIISEPVNLLAEYRLVIVEGKVITGSSYRLQGKLERVNIDDCENIEPELWEFAENIAQRVPHDVYVMDIACTSKLEYKVVELNSFSCSGMYECNMSKVIPAVSEWAEKYYRDFIDNG